MVPSHYKKARPGARRYTRRNWGPSRTPEYRRESMAFYRSQNKPWIGQIIDCEFCEKDFRQKTANNKYCSAKCRIKARLVMLKRERRRKALNDSVHRLRTS